MDENVDKFHWGGTIWANYSTRVFTGVDLTGILRQGSFYARFRGLSLLTKWSYVTDWLNVWRTVWLAHTRNQTTTHPPTWVREHQQSILFLAEYFAKDLSHSPTRALTSKPYCKVIGEGVWRKTMPYYKNKMVSLRIEKQRHTIYVYKSIKV